MKDRCSDKEVSQTCTNYASFFLYIGSLLSLLQVEELLPRNPGKDVYDKIKSIKQKYIILGIIITPKKYYMFDHILYLLDKHDSSIGYYAEEFIE